MQCPISQLVYEISTRFPVSENKYSLICSTFTGTLNQLHFILFIHLSSHFIFQFLHVVLWSTLGLPQHFRGPATRWDYCGCCPTSGWLINQRWPPLTGSTNAMSCFSARIYDWNEISTAVPKFSWAGNAERLMRLLPDVRVCWEFKMADIDRK